MDRLRRSFRDSFRRRRGENTNMSEASRLQQWQSDEMDVRAGTCFFHLKYLGCVEVFESRGMQVCEEALRKLNNRKKRIKAILYVSGDGLRVVEDDTKGLIVDQTIEKVSFCAPDRNHKRGFSYICRDGTTRRWLCHGFLALRESGERLSHAVGCAFAVCLERKQKRDRECNVTMNFDLTSATFTRTGSFKQPSLTDRLQNSNVNNNVNTLPAAIIAATSNATTSHNAISTRAVINIINNCNRKENIPTRMTPKISTKAIERPHASVSLLQRQGSFRGLSHLNHASPFKRQLSLRISDLPSNVERTRSHSLACAFIPSNKTLMQPYLLKNPVSPVLEEASTTTLANDASSTIAGTATANISNVSDQVSAMCQQLSRGLSLLSNKDDLLRSASNQSNSVPPTSFGRNLFAQKVNQQSQQIELQSVVPQSTLTSLTSTFLTQPQSFMDDIKMEQLLPNSDDNGVSINGDAISVINTDINSHVTDNSGMSSQTASAVSSIEIIPLTPPSTPPLQAGAQLPKPDQWLGKVAQLTLSVSLSEAGTGTTISTASASVSATPTSTFAEKTPMAMPLHMRAFSLSSTETVLQHSRIDEKPSSNPFNIDWALLAAKTPIQPSFDRNTNPFLTNSPHAGP